MFWMALPAAIGGINAAATLGANVAANTATGNAERLRELRRARASGEVITASGKQAVDDATEFARKASAEVNSAAARRAAMSGATSGADAAQLQASAFDASQDAYDRAASAFADARSGEEQEREDRAALQRQRAIQTVQATADAFGKGAEAGGELAGLTYDKSKERKEPDWSEMERKGADPAAIQAARELWQILAKGGMTRAEQREYDEYLSQLMEP